jgi:glycosyltransferase involved in cell wall biosynthesis
MRIGIDASMITESNAGIGYYTKSLINALSVKDSHNEYFLFTNNKKNLSDISLDSKFQILEIRSDKAGLVWILRVALKLYLKKFDLFISPSNLSFAVMYPKTIQFVHDLAPKKYPEFFPKNSSSAFIRQLNSAVKRSFYIATVSQTVRSEIISEWPSMEFKVRYVGAGIHNWIHKKYSDKDKEQIKKKYDLPEKYLLTVSTLEPRKNHINTIRAFAKFLENNPDYYLLIAGKKGWMFEGIFELVKTLGLDNRVRFLDYVPDADLPLIYDFSKGAIMLSFYEGFGLPVVEAISRGVPVLASDIAVFRELKLQEITYVNPENIEEISAGMSKVIGNKPERSVDIESEFDWGRSAERLIELYSEQT